MWDPLDRRVNNRLVGLDEDEWRARFARPWRRRRYPMPDAEAAAIPSTQCFLCDRRASNDPESDLTILWQSPDDLVLCTRCYKRARAYFDV